MVLLFKILQLCDDPKAFKKARMLGKQQRKGCKGLMYGSSPHILDSMEILKEIWESDFISQTMIQRCWRKARCLPFIDTIDISNISGRSDCHEKRVPDDTVNALCSSMRELMTKVSAFDDQNMLPKFFSDSLAVYKSENI